MKIEDGDDYVNEDGDVRICYEYGDASHIIQYPCCYILGGLRDYNVLILNGKSLKLVFNTDLLLLIILIYI